MKKTLNPLKNADSVAITHFLRIFLCLFAAFALIGILLAGIKGVIIAAIFSLTASPLIMLITSWIGGFAGSFYVGRRPKWSLREQLEGDLNRARYHKTQNRFDQAISIADEILAKEPEFPEVLFLKAQILWEGFEDSKGAKRYLKKVLEVTSAKEQTIRQWASSLYDELETKN